MDKDRLTPNETAKLVRRHFRRLHQSGTEGLTGIRTVTVVCAVTLELPVELDVNEGTFGHYNTAYIQQQLDEVEGDTISFWCETCGAHIDL